MKISQKSKIKKNGTKKKLAKPKKENVLIIAQELKFARLLASNDKKTRDRALKTLKKWLLHCFDKGYEFKKNDFARIWKGLFYAVWMSDKPLVQEELCDNIAGILDLFPAEQYTHAFLFFGVGLQSIAREWYGLDYHRMDKSLMLVRRYLRASLRCIARCGWSEAVCKKYACTLSSKDGILAPETPMYSKNATSMILHFIDCFLEEVAKVSEGNIPPSSLAELLRPFCSYMCVGEVTAICVACRRLLTALLRQSEEGLRYRHKTAAWQQMGCPEGGPDVLELVMDEDGDEQQSDDEIESGEKPLDPRAGRVDVTLPSLPTPCAQIVKMLREMLVNASPKAHKRAKICIKRFTEAMKTYPLRVPPPARAPPPPRAAPAARRLLAAEKTLVASADELALRGLSRKHRKRLLQKSRAGFSIVEDVANVANKSRHNNAAGDWLIEETEPTPKKKKADTSNKENIKKKKDNKSKTTQNGDTPPKKQKTKKEKENDNTKKENDKETKKVCPVEQKTVKVAEKKKGVKKNLKASIVVKKAKSISLKSSHNLKETKRNENSYLNTPKKVKFVLKNNCMQAPFDYYRSVQQSPNIPFDSSKKPSKANLKPSTPSPINPFFKKKWKLN